MWLQIISASITSSALTGVVVYLLSKWFEERLRASIKYEYDQKLEQFKFEQKKLEQATIVASLLSEWTSHPEDYKNLNKLMWEATLWLPDGLVIKLHKLLTGDPESLTNQFVVDIREHIQGKSTGLTWYNMANFIKSKKEDNEPV